MFIDILLLFLLVFATYTGYKRGLIVGVLSFIALVVGMAAAMKLSVVATAYLESYFHPTTTQGESLQTVLENH